MADLERKRRGMPWQRVIFYAVLTALLLVAIIGAARAVAKLNNDDCTAVTTTLPNGMSQTKRTCF